MSTNDDKPFEPGEIIEWCDETYEVVTNYGSSGVVRIGNEEIRNFHWAYGDEIAVRKEQ